MAENDGSTATIHDAHVDDTGAPAPLRAVESTADASLLVANALGAAWSTYQLHRDPRERIGFVRAIETLAVAPSLEYLTVTADHFELRGTPVEATHAGTGRLVDQLFLVGIAAVEFVDTPTGDDLYHLFEVIRRIESELDEAGRAALLRTLGATTIRIVETRALIEDDGREDTDEAPDVRTVGNPTDFTGDPAGFAAALIEAAGDDPARFADLVVRSYERVHLIVDPRSADEREAVVHTFVDMFFYLPARLQAPTISEVLSRYNEEPFRTFLDQFSSHEINALAPLLDTDSHPLLHEYARIATQDASGPIEVAGLFDSLSDGSAIDDIVEQRITEVLGDRTADATATSPAFRRLAAALPDRARYRAAGIEVFQGLMRSETADHDRRRMLRIWVGKVVSAIRAGAPDAAHDWIDAVFTNDDMSEDDQHTARVGLAKAISLPTVTDLAEMLHADPESAPALDLLRRLAKYAGPHVVELLGQEPDRSRRRQLIEMGVEVARIDPQAFITGLADPRWYLLRNLAIILGRSEHPDVVDHLHDLRTHADERVRREAIRGIYALVRDADIQPFVDALQDPEAGVRKVAATILRMSQSEELPDLLERAVAAPGPTEPKLDIVGVLATLRSATASQVLARVRDSRAPRAVRHAADLALEGAA